MLNANILNGIMAHRRAKTIFIPLPREMWVPIEGGPCSCYVCKSDGPNARAYWDTLAVAQSGNKRPDTTWTVHAPELHAPYQRRMCRFELTFWPEIGRQSITWVRYANTGESMDAAYARAVQAMRAEYPQAALQYEIKPL